MYVHLLDLRIFARQSKECVLFDNYIVLYLLSRCYLYNLNRFSILLHFLTLYLISEFLKHLICLSIFFETFTSLSVNKVRIYICWNIKH